jgi:hypothetical protein
MGLGLIRVTLRRITYLGGEQLIGLYVKVMAVFVDWFMRGIDS